MKTILAVVALIGLIALANNMTYDDEISDQEHYCEMVKTKTWPDYKGIYKKQCPQ